MYSARVTCIVLLGVLGVGSASDRALKVIEFPNPPAELSASIFYDDAFARPEPIPLEELAHQGGEFAPDQVKISLWTPTTMHISWATGLGRVNTTATPPAPYDPDSVQSIVEYGTAANALTTKVNGTNDGKTSKRVTYNYVYNAESGSIDGMGTVYESPILHHVLLPDLTKGQQYFYRVGDPTNGFTKVYNFTVPELKYPFTIGILADVGQTYNSSVTYQRLAANKPATAILVGDLSYADDWLANGEVADWLSPQLNAPFNDSKSYPDADYFVTYQPRWDSVGRLTQDIWSSIPLTCIGGNHEIESQAQNNNITNVSFNARYPMPRDPSVINTSPNDVSLYWDQALLPTMGKFLPPEQSDSVVTNNTWYSIDVGPVHIIMLTNYVPYGNTSAQYKWLEQDLANVNRTATPWVIVSFHAAIYHTYVNHYKENDEMRMMMEPLWFKYGVDIIANGHVHAYERSPPVYSFKPNSCGPIYLTMGDGGNIEGLYKEFVDQTQSVPGVNASVPAFCGNTSLWAPASYQPSYSGNGYIDPDTPFCYASQAPWSDYRDPSFGHGTLEFINATAARWRWNRNIDSADQYNDDVTIVKTPPGSPCNDKVVEGTEKSKNWDAQPYLAPPAADPSPSPTDSPSPAPGPGSAPPSSALSVVSTWTATMVFVLCTLVI